MLGKLCVFQETRCGLGVGSQAEVFVECIVGSLVGQEEKLLVANYLCIITCVKNLWTEVSSRETSETCPQMGSLER